jgi:hypothetical protein
MSGAALTLTLMLMLQANHRGLPRSGPECKGLAARPSWSAKLLGKSLVRFTFDGSGIDTCTTYYDLEFIAELFDAHGKKLGSRRFVVPQMEFNGPQIQSFDYLVKESVKRIRPVALHCKKRRVGGFPRQAGDDMDPIVAEAQRITASFKEERNSYSRWSSEISVDYEESAVVQTNRTVCSSGDQKKEVGADRSACEDVIKVAQGMADARAKAYGDAVWPRPPGK